jgi:preprotein translocase subunit SecE
MSKVTSYIAESFEELKSNVSWPTWADVQKYSVIVAVFSIVFALATWGVDTIFAKSIAGFFSWIKS